MKSFMLVITCFLVPHEGRNFQVSKCMTPNLPQAENILFWEDNNGNLYYGDVFIKDDRQDTEEGYNQAMTGDSGSGYFTSSKEVVDGGLTEDRQTIIAVHASGSRWQKPSPSMLLYKRLDVCRSWATKVSEAITTWLKRIDNDDELSFFYDDTL